MGKTGKWLKSFLTGKKEKNKEKEKEHETVLQPSPNKHGSGPVPDPSAKEKKRWSFRRSKELVTGDVKYNNTHNNSSNGVSEEDIDKTRQAIAVAAAVNKAVAAEMAVRLQSESHSRKTSSVGKDEAAVKIQAYFRAYLARKALCALRGLVKLQSLIRGQLVRSQTTDALRRMQALVAAQERIRTQRIQMVKQEVQSMSSRTPHQRRSPQHSRFKQSYEMEKNAEENIKTVVMDTAEPRSNSKSRNSSYSMFQFEKIELKQSLYSYGSRTPTKSDVPQNHSPTPSGLTDISPRGQSDHFEEFSFKTAQSSPQYHSPISNGSIDYQFYPNYMSNTKSSRAKVRSQSAPRQRHETYERQLSRKKLSLEGRNIPRGVKMQRSVSQVGIPVNGLQFPWHLKVDRSSVSVIDSECGSCSSSVLPNNNYCRSLAGYEVYGISAEQNSITE